MHHIDLVWCVLHLGLEPVCTLHMVHRTSLGHALYDTPASDQPCMLDLASNTGLWDQSGPWTSPMTHIWLVGLDEFDIPVVTSICFSITQTRLPNYVANLAGPSSVSPQNDVLLEGYCTKNYRTSSMLCLAEILLDNLPNYSRIIPESFQNTWI